MKISNKIFASIATVLGLYVAGFVSTHLDPKYDKYYEMLVPLKSEKTELTRKIDEFTRYIPTMTEKNQALYEDSLKNLKIDLEVINSQVSSLENNIFELDEKNKYSWAYWFVK